MLRIVFVVLLILMNSGCSPAKYQKADLSMYGGRQGYLEKELSPSVFLLEYSHIGGYDYDLSKNIIFWNRRALELCPEGYEGKHDIVNPAYARIEEFKCPQRFCSEYPLVTGIISCKNENSNQ